MSGLSFQRGAFIGRTAELEALAKALEASSLVTLVGTGGVGKTRLVAEFLRERGDSFCVHAVWLDEIGTAAEIPARLVKAAGLSSTGELDTERAIAELSRVKNALVFLDNAEHVVDGVREIISELIQHNIRVLVTSQVPLGLPEESLVVVPELSRKHSKDLLLIRAQLHNAAFDPQWADDLVAALDGLPLAIELAAARCIVLSPGQILMRLGSSNQVLGSLRTSRHGTLDRTIEWSWDLLDPASRDIATTIALFDHGLDPLFLDELWPEHDAVSLAQELESRSWIRVSEGMRGKAWSTLLAMRRFVRARISDENRVALEKRFAGWARAHLAELPGWWAFYVPEGLLAVKALMRDEAYADGAVLLGKLFFGAFGGTHFLEALNLAETLLNRMNRQVDSAAWAVLATKLSKGAFRYHSRHRAITWSGPAVEASPPRTTAHLAAMAQHVLCLIDIGHRNEASEILKMLVNDWPERPQDMSVVSALLDIAAVLHEMGDFEELRRTATAILAIARDAGNADAEARAWIHLSYASYDLGEFTRADEEIGHLNRLLKLRHPHERIAVGGAVAPLVALQLGRRAEAKAALIECEDVARRTHNASLDFYVELGWAEWSAREEPDLIRSHLDLALSSAHLQSSPKSVAHVRLLQTMEDLATSGFDLAAARVAALRHDGVVPAEFNKWHELLDAVEWFCQQQLAGKSGAPPSLFGELFEAVDACIGGDKQRLALLLAREPSSSWTVPGLYLLRLDDVASRLPSRIFRPGGARLSVEKNGLKFQVDDREIVDISRRQALKRILVHLAQRHRAGEVYSVSAHEVIEVGWPAEKILPAAALMRVYTTMNRMRSLGLGDLIITVEDGYALDAQVQIEWVDTL